MNDNRENEKNGTTCEVMECNDIYFCTYAKIRKVSDDFWIAYNGEDAIHSGSVSIFNDSECEEFKKYDVSINDYEYFKEFTKKLDKVVSLLPFGNLRYGIGAAIKAKGIDLLAAARQARKDSNYEFTLKEIHRVQNDLNCALSAIYLSIGGNEEEKLKEERMAVYQKNGEMYKNHGYCSTFDLFHESMNPNGFWENGILYYPPRLKIGALDVKIIPDSRISFDYKPSSDWSYPEYYTSQSTILLSDGKRVTHYNDALCMRIDLDENAPYGIALDLGRSPYDGEIVNREGDLAGKIFSSISKNGCHEYTGFSEDMAKEFNSFAEELALHQHLSWINQQKGAKVAV